MKKEKITPLVNFTLREKPVHSFVIPPYNKRIETRKCDCGSLTEDIFCGNCGESKISQKIKRKKAKEAADDKELGKWLV